MSGLNRHSWEPSLPLVETQHSTTQKSEAETLHEDSEGIVWGHFEVTSPQQQHENTKSVLILA